MTKEQEAAPRDLAVVTVEAARVAVGVELVERMVVWEEAVDWMS